MRFPLAWITQHASHAAGFWLRRQVKGPMRYWWRPSKIERLAMRPRKRVKAA